MPPPDRIPHFPCFIKLCPDHPLNIYSNIGQDAESTHVDYPGCRHGSTIWRPTSGVIYSIYHLRECMETRYGLKGYELVQACTLEVDPEYPVIP